MNDTLDFCRGARGAAAAALVFALSFAPPPAGATMPTPEGTVPPEVAQAFQSGLFAMPEHDVATRVAATQYQWNIPVIMIGFSDAPLSRTAAEFETALFDTNGAMPSGSVAEYYRWASGGKVKLTGRVIASINLPSERNFYAYGSYGLARESTPQNLYGMTRDALLLTNPSVDWGQFDIDHDGWIDMLWVIHQGVGGETTVDRTNIWSVTSRMSGGWRYGAPFATSQLLPGSLTQHYQIDRFSTMPELSKIIPGNRAEIGTYCHEFGHALGLPDLYDTSGLPAGVVNAGPGNWSLMSTGGYGGSGLTPERPSHPGAWCSLFLGWTTSVRPTQDTPVTLRPLTRGDPVIELWFQGESNPEHFIIENRYREGFDATLPASGLLIYHVDEGIIAQRLAGNHVNTGLTPGLMVVEGDGDNDMLFGLNRGDAGDPLPGLFNRTGAADQTVPHLRTFAGAFTNLAIGQITPVGEDVSFQLQVRAPGWQPEAAFGAPASSIFDSGRPGRWSRTDADRRVFQVRSEMVGGRPQVVLRTRVNDVWQTPETVSESPAAAFDPSIACLPGGDLAVVWTDVRSGRSRIFLRVRIRGVWQAETSLADLEGDGHHAAIGADSNGMVQVAWIQESQGFRRIYFKRFAYISPFGTPSPVTFTGENPDPPALEVRANGSSYLVWSDRAAMPRLYYARFHPDSGVTSRIVLTQTPASAQTGPAAAVDAQGTLHVAWQVANPGTGLTELHYHKRRVNQAPAPRDTVLDTAGYLIQNPVIACDDSGGVHLVYEHWKTQEPQPNYRLWAPGRGWDWGGTEISASGAAGVFPAVFAYGPGDVSTIYTREDAGGLQLVERNRRLGIAATSAVPRVSAGGRSPLGRLVPNPLRAGARLRIEAPGTGTHFEIYDLAGRRVDRPEARVENGLRVADIDAATTARWPGGIYFARLAGSTESRRFVVLR